MSRRRSVESTTNCLVSHHHKAHHFDVQVVVTRADEGQGESESPEKAPAPCSEAPIAKRARRDGPGQSRCCASYICRTAPILGRFDVQKAKALGVPPGPLYGKLKNGQNVTLRDGTVVESGAVVGTTQRGGSCAILQCLSVEMIDRLACVTRDSVCLIVRFMHCRATTTRRSAPAVLRLYSEEPVDCVVHMTPAAVANTDAYAAFIARFPMKTTHITTHSHNEAHFRTALIDARLLHRIAPELYANPSFAAWSLNSCVRASGNVCEGRPMLRYTLVPRGALGLDMSAVSDAGVDFELDKASIERAHAACSRVSLASHERDVELSEYGRDAEVVFLGTGSSIPSKHRNVSAIYLRCAKGSCAAAGPGMLLDVGEGTVGQLYKTFGSATPSVLTQLHAVWISHPHADHHLGLPCLLYERRKYVAEPLVLMAPWPVLCWLGEYGAIDDGARGTYVQVESSWIRRRDVPHPQAARLRDCLGITECWNARVVHCAHAYGLVVRSVSGWSLCYSGDCRPSPELVREARRVSVLIHEATFEDEFHDDAVAKKHSTVSEAISVGRDMEAHRTILTHFSQRYIEGPTLDESTASKVVVASDFMHITLPQLLWAPRLMPVVRRLFAEREAPADTYPELYPYLRT